MQAVASAIAGESEVVHLDEDDDVLRLAVPIGSRSYELHGLSVPSGAAFTWAAMLEASRAP